MKSWFVLILALILASSFVLSETTYLDIKINVLENGNSMIDGTSNMFSLKEVPLSGDILKGTTSELTSKQGKVWLFLISGNTNLSESKVEITLPARSSINYIKSTLLVNIKSDNDIITVTFIGKNKKPDISIQYIVDEAQSTDYLLFIAIVLLMIIVVILYLLFKKNFGKKIVPLKKESYQLVDKEKLDAIRPTLNETQIKIIDALLEKNGEANQTALMYMTKIPKASLSRNLELLSQKELVIKFFNGSTNYIKLHPSLKK